MVAQETHYDEGLIVRRWPAPAPCPSRLVGHDRTIPSFALLSGRGDSALASWSYAAVEPVQTVHTATEALAAMERWTKASRAHDLPPFTGGAVGHMNYELGWLNMARQRLPLSDPLGLPQSQFALYDAIYARNEITQTGFLIAQPTRSAEQRLNQLERRLHQEPAASVLGYASDFRPLQSRQHYRRSVHDILEAIRSGEVYQVNYTYPIHGRFHGTPEACIARARQRTPPFFAFLRINPSQAILSMSPECFVDFDADTRRIRTFPIKGTRRRFEDRDQDNRAAMELEHSVKDRAEHVMIVDLLRNDLGRIAEIGSVSVHQVGYLESFPTVHHLTSHISAALAAGQGIASIFENLFPGGSITGAPKLRAMEIIRDLEVAPRGVYTGCIGYLSPNGSMRLSVAIRTATIADNEVRLGVGGGIVADSQPEHEWREAITKARSLASVLRA